MKIWTTAFTDKPVSMKYRGPMKLLKRGEGFLNYGAPWTDLPEVEIYPRWWKTQGSRP